MSSWYSVHVDQKAVFHVPAIGHTRPKCYGPHATRRRPQVMPQVGDPPTGTLEQLNTFVLAPGDITFEIAGAGGYIA